MKDTVILYPMPGMGHLLPMVELAKLFLHHGFSVTVALMDSPTKHPTVEAFINRISSVYPALLFHRLPPLTSLPDSTAPYIVRFFDVIRLNNPNLLHFLSAAHSPISALIVDFFYTDVLAVAAELHLPVYFFFSSGASDLASFIYLPTLFAASDLSFKDLGDAHLHLPGVPPIPASHMPREIADCDSLSFKRLLAAFKKLPDGDGILINTFESLEPEAVKALCDGACVPDRRMPPIYCIGPLVVEGKDEKGECLAWLDKQPTRSMVFLYFGSMGTFSLEQVKQIATGLERSGQGFLWVVRGPKNADGTLPSDFDLEALLPEGFLERTAERGLVVKSWAPQVAVLNHAAVGGFVTHCGWNSMLEAIIAGVAMVAWPLYAEQRMNKVFLVEQMRLAVVMEGYDKEIVEAEEVEAKVMWLMESKGGKELQERAAAVKNIAEEARREGGTSHGAWLKLVQVLKSK